jgi:hypothetical protein
MDSRMRLVECADDIGALVFDGTRGERGRKSAVAYDS